MTPPASTELSKRNKHRWKRLAMVSCGMVASAICVMIYNNPGWFFFTVMFAWCILAEVIV